MKACLRRWAEHCPSLDTDPSCPCGPLWPEMDRKQYPCVVWIPRIRLASWLYLLWCFPSSQHGQVQADVKAPGAAEEVRSSDLRGCCYLLLWEDTASDGAPQLAWGRKPWLLSILFFKKGVISLGDLWAGSGCL